MKSVFYYLKYAGLLIIALCLSVSAGFIIKHQMERRTQKNIMDTFQTQMERFRSEQSDGVGGSTGSLTAYLDGETIGILTLERLGIEVSIREGLSSNTLKVSAGHFPGTALPGKGNFCIAGHSSFVYTCLFNDLHEAILGDVIKVETLNRTHTYKITEIVTVDPTQVEVLDPTNESRLTIVTCNNYGKKRLIVIGTEY